MIVRKFGGTSVGSPQQMKVVSEIIADSQPQIVVLSAISGITNQLERIAQFLHRRDEIQAGKELDQMQERYFQFIDELFVTETFRLQAKTVVIARLEYLRDFLRKMFNVLQEKALMADGELVSTHLFYLFLLEKGQKAELLQALNFMRIDKDLEPDEFYISENLKRELQPFAENQIFVTQGYICRNAYGEIDNLKRGGSDYSATLIGAALGAERIEIWTDISGVHNNDPRFVANTSSLPQMSFDEAAELAYFGAKILHPSSLLPARKADIAVWLKNTMKPEDEGTCIDTYYGKDGIKAIAAKDHIAVVRVKSGRMLNAYGFLRKVFEIFEVYKTSIDMITTSEVAVAVTIDDTRYLDAIVVDLSRFALVEVEKDQCIIAIVGNMTTQHKGYAAQVFNALQEVPIKMISYGASNHNVSVLIDAQYKSTALNQLHNQIFKS